VLINNLCATINYSRDPLSAFDIKIYSVIETPKDCNLLKSDNFKKTVSFNLFYTGTFLIIKIITSIIQYKYIYRGER
jgi:hypothetical protein